MNEKGIYVARLTIPSGEFIQTDTFKTSHEAVENIMKVIKFVVKQADYELMQRLSEGF